MDTAERCQRKNYYFMQTMRGEIEKFNVISFGIFDVILLRKALFAHDVLRVFARRVNEKFGISDVNFIRMNVENELRNAKYMADNLTEDISLSEIYDEIAKRHPNFPCDELMTEEIAVHKELSCVGAVGKSLLEYALEKGKRVLLIENTSLSSDVIREMLESAEISGNYEIFTSGECHKAKGLTLFQHISETAGVSPNEWLHIGCDGGADIAVPRAIGITAGFLRCPRDWYFMERAENEKESETSAPFDESLENSIKTAEDVNERFTKMVEPSEETCVKAENISMMFNMNSEKVDNFKEYVIRFLKRQLDFNEFWALKDISFEVKKGEKVALIGHNGSGKSTMLKIAAGVLKPTSGSVSVKGDVSPMIELGAGFDAELSARENVYLNGAILGLRREEMDGYYNGIIEFSELADFQDIAIKNYSSGMVARLGFAIATCRAPDVLIIDEVLAVGDFAFQEKCKKRMEQLTGEGTTVLFVSHSACDVIGLCDRAIWLEHGKVLADGEAQFIMEQYLNSAKGEQR